MMLDWTGLDSGEEPGLELELESEPRFRLL